MDNKYGQLAAVCAPYANVMIEPKPNTNNNPEDNNQDTQVLYNEEVIIVGKQNGLCQIKIPSQEKVEQEKLVPHIGWVEEKELVLKSEVIIRSDKDKWPEPFPVIVQKAKTIAFLNHKDFKDKKTGSEYPEMSKPVEMYGGTKLYVLGDFETSYKIQLIDKDTNITHIGYINKSDVKELHELRKSKANSDDGDGQKKLKEKRALLVKCAQDFLDTPYFWGGMIRDGIDCSGLTHICHRMLGIKIPRDSIDQFLQATKKTIRQEYAPKNLEAGDLIFFARTIEPEKIRHVALYLGNDQIIHAIHTDRKRNIEFKKVCITTGQEWLGKPFTQMEQGEVAEPYIIYGGTYLQ